MDVIVLENQQITITSGLQEKLIYNKVAIFNCEQYHLPIGLSKPLNGHTVQSERFKNQINASVTLKKIYGKKPLVPKL